MLRTFILTAFLISLLVPVNTANAQSVSVVITEQTINEFLRVMGPVTGKGKGKQSIKYSWKVTKPAIDFEPGTAAFRADVRVKTIIITIADKVRGKVKVEYADVANNIRMQVVEAKFPVYINVFGSKIKIATLDIGKYYKPKFEFNGPEPVQKNVEVTVGDGTTKQIGVKVVGREIVMEHDQLRVSVNLLYSSL